MDVSPFFSVLIIPTIDVCTISLAEAHLIPFLSYFSLQKYLEKHLRSGLSSIAFLPETRRHMEMSPTQKNYYVTPGCLWLGHVWTDR